MFFILSLLAASQSADGGRWVEFDRRPGGWAETAVEYDAAGLVRRGDRLRVRYRYTTFTSSVPDYRHLVRVEIDCVRYRARPYERLLFGGIYQLAGREPRREPTPTIARRIAPDSIEAVLARRLCPGAPGPAAGRR